MNRPDPFYVKTIAVGKEIVGFTNDSDNLKNASYFLHSLIAEHGEDEIAVVIQRNDGFTIGEIWNRYSSYHSLKTIHDFEHYLTLQGFYASKL
ncbi:hypothetical protein FAZ69_09410 [Trinickia terrae]|uniref:Uncharacterized protein n=1 Tax=Trinickia terrae TaxID=2571161 RepID=A0A4V5PJN8_9BURK|nr:hypothetical protein [Trinickia terrae]TKC89180.1 hypothetical protein FAZ69_09410 [Trinickia terrae]